MNLPLQPYTLPDIRLLSTEILPAGLVWQPDEVYIILGRSNTPERSVFRERALEDGAVIMKRPSGGETVVLTPRTLVVAMAWPLDFSSSQSEVFRTCNTLIMNTLNQMGVVGLKQMGISDISHGNRKIAGSAMHKARDRWFFHAVLNVGEPAGTFAWYLPHPVREPDYRKGRPHSDFVTHLSALGYSKGMHALSMALMETFQTHGMSQILV